MPRSTAFGPDYKDPTAPDLADRSAVGAVAHRHGAEGDLIHLDPLRRSHLTVRGPWPDTGALTDAHGRGHRRDPFPEVEELDVFEPRPAPAAVTATELPAPRRLRRVLVAGDVVAVTPVWAAIAALAQDSLLPGPAWTMPLQVVAAVCLTLLAARQLRLYQGRVCSDRRVMRRRLLAATAAAPVAVAVARKGLGYDAAILWSAVAVAAPWATLTGMREVYEQWLRASRLRGRYVRPIVLAGTPDEVRQIAHLLDAHPETGFRPVGWIGRAAGAAGPRQPDELDRITHLGESTDSTAVRVALARSGATGVLVGPTAAAWPGFPKLARYLQDDGLHVQMWSGMWGISSRRLRPVQLAHEPFFYLERAGTLTRTPWIKRALDVTVASVVLVAASPVLAVSALLIKLHDRGPVFFRQKRVGLHGEVFELRKLRTMGVDAEARLKQLKAAGTNERSGPLFKLAADPRVTPIGKLLRATSIDELPQLLDVLSGKLSLVGPRPALPSEVAEFDRALLDRHGVLPGLTGLWQAEARHNPSFDAYRHLDLFYVENWTVALDVLILLATVRTVMTDTVNAGSRFLEKRRRRPALPVTEDVIDLDAVPSGGPGGTR